MTKAIYVSINPTAVSKITTNLKNHEFRNYLPKKNFDTLYVYTTSPKSELKYILKIGKIAKYPEKISINGDGNEQFNKGEKAKYAYEISDIYELEEGLSLKLLKEKYNFVPPQSYAYDERYEELTKK